MSAWVDELCSAGPGNAIPQSSFVRSTCPPPLAIGLGRLDFGTEPKARTPRHKQPRPSFVLYSNRWHKEEAISLQCVDTCSINYCYDRAFANYRREFIIFPRPLFPIPILILILITFKTPKVFTETWRAVAVAGERGCCLQTTATRLHAAYPPLLLTIQVRLIRTATSVIVLLCAAVSSSS